MVGDLDCREGEIMCAYSVDYLFSLYVNLVQIDHKKKNSFTFYGLEINIPNNLTLTQMSLQRKVRSK